MGEKETPIVLPTATKDKIGKQLGYPCGAETISQIFVDLPQAARSRLYFLRNPVFWASRFNEILRNGKPYTLLTCHCLSDYATPPYGGVYIGQLHNIHWEVKIYPVLRELKAEVRELLQREGFPPLREFLLRTHRVGEKPEIPMFSLTFHPGENCLHYAPQVS